MKTTNQWKQYSIQSIAPFYRTGWIGVWDAIVALVTRKGRTMVIAPVTISFWAKSNTETEFSVSCTQMETKQ